MRASFIVGASVLALALASAGATRPASAAPPRGGTLEQACKDLGELMFQAEGTLLSLGNCTQYASKGYYLCMSWRATLQHDLIEMQQAWDSANCDSIL